MFTSLIIDVANICNSRCTMCHIWKNKTPELQPVDFYRDLFSDPQYQNVTELSFTGGEVFLRRDIKDLVKLAVEKLPRLRKLMINTNGSFPKRVESLLQTLRYHIDPNLSIMIFVSIDGDDEVNRMQRGIEHGHLYRETLDKLRAQREQDNRISFFVSSTFTSINTQKSTFETLKALAQQYGALFTFRPFFANSSYYGITEAEKALTPSPEQKDLLIDLCREYENATAYYGYLARFLEGQVIDEPCTAGVTFQYIRYDGVKQPCPWLSEITEELKKQVCNSCCSECRIYPMLNASPHEVQPIETDDHR